MSAGALVVSVDGPVLTLRIHNPGRANALDDALLAALPQALTGAAAHAARVVVLTGTGERAFSAGVALEPGEPEEQAAMLLSRERALGAAVAAIEACPRPVIAALNGAAMGGALELAVACDWRIAAESARLAMPPGRLGVVYAPEGLRRFVALIGPARTGELFLTARTLTAHEALAWGLVNEVREPGELAEIVAERAAAVAALAPIAVAGTRAIVRGLAAGDPADVVAELAERWRARAAGSADLREGLAAFADRRPPEFTGS